jgi:hypothetical protein
MNTMEEQIKKLKKLADEYADFVGRTPIEHLTVFEYSKDYSKKLSVYFTKERKYSINFGGVEITEYTNNITLPLNYKAKDLEKEYNYARKFLDKKKEEIEEKMKKAKEQEIKELRKKLEQMENEKQ